MLDEIIKASGAEGGPKLQFATPEEGLRLGLCFNWVVWVALGRGKPALHCPVLWPIYKAIDLVLEPYQTVTMVPIFH